MADDFIEISSTHWVEQLPKHCPTYQIPNYVPISAFKHVDLRQYLPDFEQCSVAIIYNTDESGNKVAWIGCGLHIAGYYVYFRWLGVEDDPNAGLWLHIGDPRIVPIQNIPYGNFKIIPPQVAIESCGDPSRMMPAGGLDTPLHRALSPSFVLDRDLAKTPLSTNSRVKIGMRAEILSKVQGANLRLGTLRAVLGRRLCFDIYIADDPTINMTFWIDQYNTQLFHVGWAALNGFGILADSDYIKHSQDVASALRSGTPPPYTNNDLRKEDILEFIRVESTFTQIGKFERRMKLEVQDPLNSTNSVLHVATVHRILSDGFMIISLDGPNSETDLIPLHCLSPNLFPVGYCMKHGIELKAPPDVKHFEWSRYLSSTNSQPAPITLFKPDPLPERLAEFPIGSKIEAFDTVERIGICPATIKSQHGRLLRIAFDGWLDEFDQFLDIDSPDLFPVGWCQMLRVPLDPVPEPGVPYTGNAPRTRGSTKKRTKRR